MVPISYLTTNFNQEHFQNILLNRKNKQILTTFKNDFFWEQNSS